MRSEDDTGGTVPRLPQDQQTTAGKVMLVGLVEYTAALDENAADDEQARAGPTIRRT